VQLDRAQNCEEMDPLMSNRHSYRSEAADQNRGSINELYSPGPYARKSNKNKTPSIRSTVNQFDKTTILHTKDKANDDIS
jgi:hypothetical protein